jgi:hypothetical protein
MALLKKSDEVKPVEVKKEVKKVTIEDRMAAVEAFIEKVKKQTGIK